MRARLQKLSPRAVRWIVTGVVALGALSIASGAIVGYGAVPCTSCHVMRPYGAPHGASSHAGVSCSACHMTGQQAFSAPISGMRWVSGSVLGRRPSPSLVHDDACRRCHALALRQTVTSSGMRVRHADFAETRCSVCHAGLGHELRARLYSAPAMEQCTGCHKTSASSPASCRTCHVGERANANLRTTAWRTTHGADWKTAHGLGDMKTCTGCHAPSDCAHCHVIALPHPPQWSSNHGATARMDNSACGVCHARAWCDSCHGIEMPHAANFIAKHEFVAKTANAPACLRCHAKKSCDACHLASAHPHLPGVEMMKHLPGRRQ